MNGLKIGKSVIMPHCYFNSKRVTIGDNSFVNRDCKFYSSKKRREKGDIIIGNNVFVGMNVSFCTVSHEIGTQQQRAGKHLDKDIVVRNGCWIGINSTILQGVTIGEGTVIGANSLVVEDCEPNSLYVGIPARKIKQLL